MITPLEIKESDATAMTELLDKDPEEIRELAPRLHEIQKEYILGTTISELDIIYAALADMRYYDHDVVPDSYVTVLKALLVLGRTVAKAGASKPITA